MSKTVSLLILSALLLLEHTQGKSIKAEGTEPSNEYTESRKVFNDAVIAKLSTLSEEPLELGRKLLQVTYEDDLDNESVKDIIACILRDYHNIKTDTDKIILFLRLNFAFDFLSGPIDDEVKKRDFFLLVKRALDKRGIKDTAIEFRKTYDEFLEWLVPEIKEYSHSFTSEEKLSVMEFKKLCFQYKEDTNFEERKSLADKLVESFKTLLSSEK